MINETELEHRHCHHHFKRISWSAVLVGALIGVGLGFLLNLFSLAIGLTAFNLNQAGTLVLAAGGFIGLIIGVIVSMFVAGYAAGYLGRFYCPQRNLGIVYGFTTWSLALLLAAVLGAQMSSYLSTYSNSISKSVLVISPVSKTEAATSEPVMIKSVSTPNANNQKALTVTAPSNSLTYGAFCVFLLFFIGAVSACVGGCCGMKCKRDD